MPTVARRYAHTGPRDARAANPHADELRAPVVLMVSGGADSTALLVRACTSTLDLSDGRGEARVARERIHVLHVNHHLRGEASDGDEQFVRDLCDRYGVPLCVEHASFSDVSENLEGAAREVRYAAARRYVRELSERLGTPRSAARIVTAHTASDRAETFFMNAIKGSGVSGLSSIPARRNIIVRPLIRETHDDLCRYLQVQGVPWREDETNQDTSYLRNFVRHRIMPLARERNARLERTVGSTCDILGDEDAFMSQLAATALRAMVRREDAGLVVLDARKLAATEVAVARRIVRLACKRLEPEARLEMRHIEGVLAMVAAGEGSLSLAGGIDARMEFGMLRLRTGSSREEAVATWLPLPGRIALSGGRVLEASLERIPAGVDLQGIIRTESLEWGRDRAYVDAASLGFVESDLVRMAEEGRGLPAELAGARLWVDSPAPGDVMCPLGMKGRSKKLSDILGQERVPVSERTAVPVVRTAPGGAVVWVAGIRPDDRFKCTSATKVLVRLDIRTVNPLV